MEKTEDNLSNKRQVQDILSPDSPQQNAVKKQQKIKGTSGLQNLGNTCFMNSALQCLTNTTPLTKFFLTGEWESQVNEDNPLGMKGQIPRAYADLVHNMWGPNQSYPPRLFKRTIGERNPTFVGYGQQDSHELLQSLLDGLHEDLNRIKKKEYVEDPEIGSMTEDQFAKLSWGAYTKRNDSVIVDLFQAQLKSRTECNNCGHVSIKFDPFMYLQLPIPEPTHSICEITVLGKSSSDSDQLKPQTMKFRVPKRFSVGELKMHVAKQLKWSANAQTLPYYSVCADIFNSAAFKIFKDTDSISEFGSNDKIFIYELDEVEGKFCNLKVWKIRSQGKRMGLPVEHKAEGKPFGIPSIVHLPSLAFDPIPESQSNEELGKMMYHLIVKSAERFSNSPLYRKVGSDIDFSSISADKPLLESPNLSHEKKSDEWEPLPGMFVIKKGVKSGYSAFGDQKQIYPLKTPIVSETGGVTSPKSEVSELAQNLDQNELHEKDIPMAKNFFFKDTDYFFAEWKSDAAEYVFGSPSSSLFEPVIVQSADEKDADNTPKTITVEQCMDEFTKEEILDGNDTMYCTKCKEHQPTKKKLTVYSTPDILVIHLKRFSSHGRYGSRSKLDDFVDAPINGLDMSKLTTSGGDPDDKIYDLFAVSNHFGGLGGGHYTAYIKNPLDGEWYDCDDSRVTLLDSKVMTKAAYLLFYRRRNLPSEDITTIVHEANERYQSELREQQRVEAAPQHGGLNPAFKYSSATSTAVPSLSHTRANSDAGNEQPSYTHIVPFGNSSETQSTGFSFGPSSKIDEASSEVASFGTERENSPEPSDVYMEVDYPIREWPSDSAVIDHNEDNGESFNTASSESWEKIEKE
ncbi:Ubiquitin carboxyl-terminal hydrolase 15 [Terramyces sp. JEL0728]|nr:Ubiquitin carboxyl-terminal hydrolase 15 [Terramyces sp. JEL0728]